MTIHNIDVHVRPIDIPFRILKNRACFDGANPNSFKSINTITPIEIPNTIINII